MINQQKAQLIKYVASFNYFDKSLVVLSTTSGSISIASFATVTRAPVGIARASFSLEFLMSTGIIKQLLKQHKIKRKIEKQNILRTNN